MTKLPSKFKDFVTKPKTHNIFEGGRGGGKTRTIASFLVDVANVAPIKVLCARETQKSLKESSFLVIKEEIFRKGLGENFQISESKGLIVSHTGARFSFIGLLQHTVDSIKSYEGYHWAWIEEAQAVSKKSFEVLIPTLRQDGQFKLPGTDYVYPLRMFMYTLNPFTWDDPINIVLPDTREDTRRININYYDNPWFPDALEEERKEAKGTMTDDEYLRIWEGIPFEDTERAIIKRADILDAMNRKAIKEGGVVVGADIARFGSDLTVFVKRKGLQVIDVKKFSKIDTQEIASRLIDFASGGKIIIDDTGIGGGVTDRLNKLNANVVPINFGAKSTKKNKYPDIISEMWFNLSGMIHEIGLPDDNSLLMELAGRNYSYTKDERRAVESKENYKKRTGRKSPDIADATILCFYNRDTEVSVPSVHLPL